jgi:hypothetical protein
MKIAIAAFIIIVGMSAAYAQMLLLHVGSGGFGDGGGGASSGKILLVDGASFILQTDGTSKICRAAGC